MLAYKTKKAEIEFCDVEDNVAEYGVYTANICRHHHNELRQIPRNRFDDDGQGKCSIFGCTNEAEYAIRFTPEELYRNNHHTNCKKCGKC